MTRCLILGATGRMASLAARELSDDHSIQLRLTSHRDEGVARLKQAFPGAEVVKTDWMDGASLTAAFADVDRALMVTPDFTEEAVVVANTIAAARATPGFELLVRMIAIGPITEADMTPEWLATKAGSAMHWVARAGFKDCGLPICFVNVASYTAFNLTWLTGEAIKTRRELTMTGDAARLWIVETDVAEVFAKILREGPNVHAGREYVLTGPERLRYPDIAAILSEALGEPVKWVESADGYKQASAEHAAALATYAKYSSKHASKQQPTQTIEELLGKPPTTMRQYVSKNVALFM